MKKPNPNLVYLNGKYLPIDQAQVSVLDRGFLLGDSVYEVIPVYFGKAFRLNEHLDRLDNSLKSIRLENTLARTELTIAIEKIITQSDCDHQSVYLQITRGVSEVRDHVFPDRYTPTLFIMSTHVDPHKFGSLKQGIKAITLDDIRWRYCSIKATTLLANVLARQRAADDNALEAILIRDGFALEGAASNLFIVEGSTIVTPPKGEELLPGITRDLILELAQNNSIATEETAISLDRLKAADEIWLSSSVREIVPVVMLDNQSVNDGLAGPMWRKVTKLFNNYKQSLKP